MAVQYNTMKTETAPAAETTTLDLTGLPAPVIECIKQLVASIRNGTATPVTTTEDRPALIGRFAHLGYSFPKEEIDEAQREMWANFPREFPEVPTS